MATTRDIFMDNNEPFCAIQLSASIAIQMVALKLDVSHWSKGGTFVTNIGADEMPIFRKAVKMFGNPDIVLIEESQAPAPKEYGGCLHNKGLIDLTDFWEIVFYIRSKEDCEKKEREECAKICESDLSMTAWQCAEAIRARPS